MATHSSRHPPPPVSRSDPKPITSPKWQRMDAMLDEAGRQSFPASDPPALFVEDPVTPPQHESSHASTARVGGEEVTS